MENVSGVDDGVDSTAVNTNRSTFGLERTKLENDMKLLTTKITDRVTQNTTDHAAILERFTLLQKSGPIDEEAEDGPAVAIRDLLVTSTAANAYLFRLKNEDLKELETRCTSVTEKATIITMVPLVRALEKKARQFEQKEWMGLLTKQSGT